MIYFSMTLTFAAFKRMKSQLRRKQTEKYFENID